MPLWPNPFLRDPLAYPAGLSPGFDPAHPAAKGIGLYNGFILTPRTDSSYVSPLPVTSWNQGAALTAKIRAFGPAVLFTALGQARAAAGGYTTVTPSSLTMAGFAEFTGTGNGSFVPVASFNLVQSMQWGMTGAKNIYFYASASATSSFTISLNVPYFIAISAISSSTCNIVVTNLTTGQIFSSTTTAGAFGALAARPFIGLDQANVNQGNGYIGPVALAVNNFMPMQAMLSWAADPWSFWYPNPLYSIVGVAAAPASQFTSFTNPGAHVTRRIETVGY